MHHKLYSLFRVALVVFLAHGVTACASIVSGTDQTITLNTNPPDAQCKLERNGKMIGQVPNTPGGILIEKTKHDIKVVCSKEGYDEATGFLKSEIEGSTWGNIILGGGIGWAIDSARGADNRYEDYITITLVKSDVAAASSCPMLQLETAMMVALDNNQSEKKNEKLGRHEIIFGRFQNKPGMIRDGFLRYSYNNERDFGIGQECSPLEHMRAAEKALPLSQQPTYPEADTPPYAVEAAKH